ncbi:MAG: PhnD/SsuA/transferrin family substrate-binding protein [Thiohalospira sp.]
MAAFCLLVAPAQADRRLVLGILAVEPVEVAEERWQPLLDYLDDELDDVRIEGVIADHTGIEEQLRHNRLDFLLTNPSHYIRFRSESALSGALATLVPEHQGMAVRGFGGVAFTRAGRDDLSGWADVPGQRVAAVREISLGGYQAQAMELRERGLELPRDEHLDFVGMPHDRVVDAVMSGAADVGFVRIGVLERLWESGELARDAVRILEEEALPGFPLTLSTRLYPEWPFVALNHAEPEVGRRVLVALLRLDADDPAARAAGIAGFSVPRDYAPVEELARELRLPPYEAPPALRWGEFWERYWIPMVLLGIALVGLSAMAFGLQVANRRRRRAQQQAEENAFALADSERQARALIRALPDTLFRIDIDGTFLDCEVNDESTLLMPRETFIGQKLGALFPAEYVEPAMEAIRRALSTGEVAWYEYTTEALGQAGHFEARVVPLDAREVLMIVRDVSQRHAMEEEQRAARRFRENLLASLGEGVFGIDTRGCYTFLNHPPCRDLCAGYKSRERGQGIHPC